MTCTSRSKRGILTSWVYTTCPFLTKKYDVFTTSHVPNHSLLKTLLKQTNPNGYPLLSHIIQPFALYQPLFTNTLTSCPHLPSAPTFLMLLPSLLSAAVTILVIYLLAPNFVTLTKVTNPVARFDADTTAWHATTYQTDSLATHFILRAKQDPFIITLTVTLKTLFTWYNAIVVTNNT